MSSYVESAYSIEHRRLQEIVNQCKKELEDALGKVNEKEQEREMKKKYYIFECPGCKQQVRIPNRGKKGRVAIVCPACKTRFVRMRW